MAKDKLTDYDATASNNTDVGGISVAEGMLPSGVNNAIREQMSHLKDFASGTTGIDVLSLVDDDASHAIKLQAPSALTANTTFTLPDGDGASGQTIVTDGSGTLSWAAGSVLQVKTAVDTALRTTVSQTFEVASNTAQVTITPFSSASKFLITCCGVASCDDGNDGWFTTIFRDSTNLGNSVTGLAHGISVAGVQVHFHPFSMTVLDSPATASAITYGLQFRSYNHDSDGALTTRIGQHLAGTSNPVPTHITVMEIAG